MSLILGVTSVLPAGAAPEEAGDTAPGIASADGAPEGPDDGSASVPENGAAAVVAANVTAASYGSLSITKELEGETSGVPAGTTFGVSVLCDAPERGADVNYAATFELAPYAAQGAPQLPVGTSCAIAEGDLPSLADDSYAWGDPPAEQTVVIQALDGAVDVTLTNTVNRVYARPTITKVVANLDGLDGTGSTFSGGWECTRGGATVAAGTWLVTGPGPAELTATTGSLDAIPVTSLCSVTGEDEPLGAPHPDDPSYVWGAPDISGPVQLTAAGGDITVTNQIIRSTGAFLIGKTVVGGDPGVAFEDSTFTFEYLCLPPSGPVISGLLQASAAQTVSLPSDMVVPVGSECVIVESSRPDTFDPYAWGDVTFGGEGVTDDGGTASFTVTEETVVAVIVTNTLEKTSVDVTVAKQVTGEVGGLVDGTALSLGLQCTVPGADVPQTFGPAQVTDGGMAVITVPYGSECAATESEPDPGALVDGSFTWGAPAFDPDTEVAIQAPTTFTVTNTIERVYTGPATLTVLKGLEDPDGVVAGDFPFTGTWQCQYGEDPVVSGTWSVAGAGEADVTGFPQDGVLVGSECSVAEDEVGDLPAASDDPSYAWGDIDISGPVVIGAGGATLAVTNHVQRESVGLTLAKELTGDELGEFVDTEFAFTWLCTDASGGVHAGEAALVPGGSVDTSQDIPIGSTCVVAEGELPDAGPQYTWQPVGIEVSDLDGSWNADPQTQAVTLQIDGTGADGTNPVVTVTNGVVRQDAGSGATMTGDPSPPPVDGPTIPGPTYPPLASTGSPVSTLALWALAMLVSGVAAAIVGRRRA